MKLRIKTPNGTSIREPFLDLHCLYRTSDSMDWSFLASKYEGTIGLISEDGTEQVAGKLDVIKLSAAEVQEAHCPIYEMVDISQEIMDTCSPLIDWKDLGQFWHPRVLKVFEYDVYGTDITILSRLNIDPDFRGNGLGLWASHMVVRKLCLDGLAVLKPFPLQFEAFTREHPERLKPLGLEGFRTDAAAATGKLVNYYGKLGFQRLPRTPLMVFSPAICQPSLTALGLDIV